MKSLKLLLVMKLYLMHMSTNGLKHPQRDIIALKKMQGVSRCKLLNP
jgi:hypothetical protein